jgi:hypothetical protein
VAAEFLEHANDEQRHADLASERISQLGGEPDLNPAILAGRSHTEYAAGTDLRDMVAEDLVAERVAISTYTESTLLGRRVLRSAHPALIAQEIYALLAVYQMLRIAITDAAESTVDPDRASFTIALQTARDLIAQAANVIAETTIDLVGTIGRHLLDNLMPARRLRVSPRAVKRPLSRYAYKSLGVDRRSYLATLRIDILAGQPILTKRDDP